MTDGLTEGEELEEEFAEGSGDPVWDDWANRPWLPEMPVLHLDGFDGPMDLLLDLAERQRKDFVRMSIRDLAEQFLAAVERLAGRIPLERWADWLVLATRLVLLRSRLLFPASSEAAIEVEREAGVEVRRLEGPAGVPTIHTFSSQNQTATEVRITSSCHLRGVLLYSGRSTAFRRRTTPVRRSVAT